MKKQITVLFTWLMVATSFAQTTFTLDLIAEGNFGTTNGDVFRRNTTVSPPTTSSGVYQTANSTTGFNVLQDFVVLGNKAIIAEKPGSNCRVVIADYPSLNEVHTFTTSNAPQTLKFVSPTKAYVSMGNPGDLQVINLANNTWSTVSDPTNKISSSSSFMEHINGVLYVAMGQNIVKVDTSTNAVTGVINLSLGNIKGMVYDQIGNKIWILNGSGKLQSIDIANSFALGTIINTGISSTKLLRLYNQKLYFWSSSKKMYLYNINTPGSLPLSEVFTSTLPGASYSFAYGRSFDIDTNSGDFVICSANTFSAPGHYQVVDGSTYSIIETGSIPNCAIPNKCILKTFDQSLSIVPDLDSLALVSGQCSVQLTAPTANSGVITATTTDPISYTSQGNYTVTWTYSNGSASMSQTQSVIVKDTIPPVPTISVLDTIKVSCDEQIDFKPMALDNCVDSVTATTNSSLMYTTAGVKDILWTYADGNGNSTTQNQPVLVICNETDIEELSGENIRIYPNPVTHFLHIEMNNDVYQKGVIYDLRGRIQQKFSMNAELNKTVDVRKLSAGIYIVQFSDDLGNYFRKKMIIQ
ncbi:MAG: T9SS type A sorting domain-containing protein [Flavobacteriales bacterium]|jgi:hypothetical protein|nr:T9SS type A sorting domain-containing protein [Flavobacteriales bacterium]